MSKLTRDIALSMTSQNTFSSTGNSLTRILINKMLRTQCKMCRYHGSWKKVFILLAIKLLNTLRDPFSLITPVPI